MINKDLTNLCNELRKHIRFQNLSENTERNYTDAIEAFLKYFNRKPQLITFSDAFHWLSTLGVHQRRAGIAALKFFYSNCLNSDKMNKLKYPKIPEHVPDVMTVDEVNRLISGTDNLKHQTIIMMLYTTGMRKSELINLRWNKIDVSSRTIFISQGKGRKDRIVKLTEKMESQLVTYCDAYFDGGCFDTNDYIFKGQNGKGRYSARSVSALVETYRVKAGIKRKVTPHSIRHSTGKHLRDMGVDLATIQELFGHKKASTTRIYARLESLKNIPDLF